MFSSLSRLTLATALAVAAPLTALTQAAPASPHTPASVPPIPLKTDIPGPAGSYDFGRVTVLPNHNIVVVDIYYSPSPGQVDIGAVYLYAPNGTLISRLTGSQPYDRVGESGITVLANGHFVVSSPNWAHGTATAAGAATWVNAATGLTGTVSAANSLVGAQTDDRVGDDVRALNNGHYVVLSPFWDNGSAIEAGAVTWANGNTGLTGVVSVTNSLVGTQAHDQVGQSLVELANGHAVINSYFWNNGSAVHAGAVTWMNGATGLTGAVSAANSLVGSLDNSLVGLSGIVPLDNGHYVVVSPAWDMPIPFAPTGGGPLDPGQDVGAVTWGHGSAGVTGTVSAANSFIGVSTGDRVGEGGVAVLPNNHVVVSSPYWDNGTLADVGAVTWLNSAGPITGTPAPANSLIGELPLSFVGSHGVTVLANGHYVAQSPFWRYEIPAPLGGGGGSELVMSAGAVTWANGNTGLTGTVSAANSLVGTRNSDQVGGSGVRALANGHYVVASVIWDNGLIPDAGAVTWGNGFTGITGPVTVTNSLVGSSVMDYVGTNMLELANGHYVVFSPAWDNVSTPNVGAVTWANGNTGLAGPVNPANSLIGSSAGDAVGDFGGLALSNGHYVALSPFWDNGSAANAGAVTWVNGFAPVVATVHPGNSLVGTVANSEVGWGALELSDGNYVVFSPYWDNGSTPDVGAVTWANGAAGLAGLVSPANSLVGVTAHDRVGSMVEPLPNGGYAVFSEYFDKDGLLMDSGAVTYGRDLCGAGPLAGPVTADNSVLGGVGSGGSSLNFAYHPAGQRLVVGRPGDNLVTLFGLACHQLFLPLVRR